MLKPSRIITISFVLLVLFGLVYLFSRNNLGKPIVAGANTTDITVKIPFRKFQKLVAYTPDMTALEATKIAVNSEVVWSSGEVVEILGTPADRLKREYWELLINNQSALLSADKLKLNPGDEIDWQLSKF